MEKTKQIRIEYAKSTGFDSFFLTLKKDSVITIPIEPFAGGGFGDVYHAILFDGKKSPIKQVVKIFKDDRNEHGWRTISELQDALIVEREYSEKVGEDFLNNHPGFIGFPQLIFEGELNGRKVRGHITVDLISIGCSPLDKILPLGDGSSNEGRKAYLMRNPLDRAIMAYQLADCFNMLHHFHYIHADITPDNIMVSLSEPLCVIIDYDSGVIVKNSDDNPITYGKPGGDWTPPEIQIEACTSGYNKISINHFMDLWSIAAAIHNIIFGFPHLFLAHMTRPAYQEYVKKYPHWPDINIDDESLVNPKSKQSYQFYRNKLFDSIGLSEQTISEFRLTFTKGIFDSSYRTPVEVWLTRLKKEIGVEYFSCMPTFKWMETQKGEKTILSTNGNKDTTKKDPLSGDRSKQNHQKRTKDVVRQHPQQSPNTPSSEITPSQESNKNNHILNSYLEELLPDLISGKVSLDMHKGFITKYAKENGFDGDYISDLQEFVKLFKESTKDKTIANFEYIRLILLAKLINVKKDLVDQLLKPYKRK